MFHDDICLSFCQVFTKCFNQKLYIRPVHISTVSIFPQNAVSQQQCIYMLNLRKLIAAAAAFRLNKTASRKFVFNQRYFDAVWNERAIKVRHSNVCTLHSAKCKYSWWKHKRPIEIQQERDSGVHTLFPVQLIYYTYMIRCECHRYESFTCN